MKKSIVKQGIVFCLVGILMMFVFVAQAQENKVGYTFGEGENIATLCADDLGGCYIATENHLYYIKDNMQKIEAQVQNVREMVYGEGELYAITENHEIVMLKDAHTWQVLGQNTQAKGTLYLCRMSYAQRHIYYMYKDENDLRVLYDYDIEKNTFTDISPFANIDNSYFFHHKGTNTLCTISYDETMGQKCILKYDIEKAQMCAPVPLSDIEFGILNIYYDAFSDTVYLTTRNALYRADFIGNVTKVLEEKGLSRILPLSDGKFVCLDTGGVTIYPVYKTEQKSSTKKLTVMGFSSLYNDAFEKAKGVSVTNRKTQDKSMMEQIAETLITQDDQVDIFFLWAEDGLERIERKKYYVDLSQSEVLVNASKELFPAFLKAVKTEENVLCAWPFFASPSFLFADEKVLAQYQLKVPCSFDELLNLIPQVYASNLLEEQGYVMFDTMMCNREDLFRYFVQQYMRFAQLQGNLSFESEQFMHIAKRICTEIPLEDPVVRSEEGLESPLFSLMAQSNALQENYSAPFKISAQENSAFRVPLMVMVINPYSKNQAEAFDYIEFMATKRTVEDYALYATMTEPKADTYMQEQYQTTCDLLRAEEKKQTKDKKKIHELEQEKEMYKENLFIVSQKAIDQYHVFSTQFVVPVQQEIAFSDKMEKLILRVIQDHMPLEQFAQKADAYVKMVHEEQGVGE